MALSEQENRVLHVAVRRYDPAQGSGYLDPETVGGETGIEPEELAGIVENLVAKGYLEHADARPGKEGGKGPTVRPTDKGLLTAMGLA